MPLNSSETGEPLGESTVSIGPEIDKVVSVDLQLPDHDQPFRLHYYYAFARPTALSRVLSRALETAPPPDP